MATCPWYVSAHAVRRWMMITGRNAEEHFDDASDELIELAAATWARYEEGGRAPKVSRTGAYVYRSAYVTVRGRRDRVDMVVSMERRPEGPKPQLVDLHWGGETR